MNNSTIIFYVNGDSVEEHQTNVIPFSQIIELARKEVPLVVFDTLYKPIDIVAIDLSERTIEIECEII